MSHLKLVGKPTPEKRLFIAGKLHARKNARPCSNGHHAGPLLNTARYEAAGGIWRGCGECGTCFSTIHKDQLQRTA